MNVASRLLLTCVLCLCLGPGALASHATPEEARAIRSAVEMTRIEWLGVQRRVREKIVLPVSRPFHQGSTHLCWAYATLNAIETNYLVASGGKKLELSRAEMQYLNWEDRYLRKLQQNEDYLYEGGTTVDGITLLRGRGMLAHEDYLEKPKSLPTHSPFSLEGDTPEEMIKSLYALLDRKIAPLPETAHFEGAAMTPKEMVEKVLGDETWEAYAPSPDGKDEIAKHWDPDARRGTLAHWLPREKFLSVVKASLEAGHGLAISLCGHDIELYGAEFDVDETALTYYVKDNYENSLYKMDPSKMPLGQRFCGLSTIKVF